MKNIIVVTSTMRKEISRPLMFLFRLSKFYVVLFHFYRIILTSKDVIIRFLIV